MEYFINRLKEASTWQGIIAAATAATGWSVSDDMQLAVAGVGVALFTAVSVFWKEKGSKDSVE